ncbi:GNAT family N-acetyltransferase [Flagellatimonas centrodinii]|uniref:GNAT family N-acetyltransferase n=1 Tax=Flagellatimonas centrodinii TaxID=2806210 RepID=UPI001FEEDD54|nr:GNAT family protein [Flagellatimonas centrodinii]ULQ46636.1 GNAT family N-acetyltransferase [Flagellatimonas centrodinii]
MPVMTDPEARAPVAPNAPLDAVRVEKRVLENATVRLEPLAAHHLPGLASAIHDGELWQLPVTNVPHPDDLPQFLADAEAAYAIGRDLSFATIDRASGEVAGSTRFRFIEPTHRRAEIGFTFIARRWQRTHINTSAKLLMLTHAFEVWLLNRVELLTDVRNQASRTAIARIGATQEGILRQHMVMRDGHVRDSVIFSLTRPEWPAVKAALQARIAADPVAAA